MRDFIAAAARFIIGLGQGDVNGGTIAANALCWRKTPLCRVGVCRLADDSAARDDPCPRAVARPWRAGAGVGDCARWTERDLGKLRFDRDPLVADAQCGRAGAAVSRRCRQCGGPAQGRTRGDRRRRRAHCDLERPATRSPMPCWKAIRRRSRRWRCRPTARHWRRRRGITRCGCGRSRAACRGCLTGIPKTSTAWRSLRMAAPWSASATI